MPSPKSGSPGTIVPPTAPTEAKDADVADPGQVESVKAGQRQTQTGKYGAKDVKPFKKVDDPNAADDPTNHWIEVTLVDKTGKPVPGEVCQITLSDDSVWNGALDEKGFVRLDHIPAGTCKVTFSNREKSVWKKL